MPSLIQQRMALERSRTGAVWTIVLSVFWQVMGVVRIASDDTLWLDGGYLVLGVVFAVLGVRQLRAARRAFHLFEAEHGPGAGRQL
jgi:hypothetical protein